MHRYVLYNGRVVSADESIFKPGQLGLLSGWGVFSTLRIGRGVEAAPALKSGFVATLAKVVEPGRLKAVIRIHGRSRT